MAIDKKIPSPQEISNSPISIPSNDIDKIKKLQVDLSNLNSKFGQLTINKIKLEEEEELLKKELSSILKEEANIAKTFTDKYGKGSLDIETGEFTPIK
tara:strand:- start:1780 stop:2073 length:294 start_codon:yes stop_codon:yes gene_type:complete